MEVDVQVRRRTEALDHRHRAGPEGGAAQPRPGRQMPREQTLHRAQRRPEQRRTRRQQQ
jgi:hypothetical protein